MGTPVLDEPAQAAAHLARNAVDCLPEGQLAAKLALGRPLRVKLGIDPTAPDIHFGHTVVFNKLREFQDAGHTVVLIIGDYTARVGDPSGRSATRPVLSPEAIDANAETYRTQAMKILRSDRLELRHNSEWLDMPMEDLFRLMRVPTVAQILERDDFAKRWAAREPISLLELLYPVLQGYDSVAVDADVECGGTDQKFNLLMGRAIQSAFGKPQQVVLTMPILRGTDGERRMGKSLGNYVGVSEEPGEIYGKTLSIPDELMPEWFDLLLTSEVPADLGPRDAKHALAHALVERYHGAEAADAARGAFEQVHVRGGVPDELPAVEAGEADPVHLPELLVRAFGGSRSDARRALTQGGVRVDGSPLPGDALDVPAAELRGRVLQMGKRRFARIV